MGFFTLPIPRPSVTFTGTATDFEDGDLGASILHIWPSYLAYAVSFVTIGIMWVNHHHLIHAVREVTPRPGQNTSMVGKRGCPVMQSQR